MANGVIKLEGCVKELSGIIVSTSTSDINDFIKSVISDYVKVGSGKSLLLNTIWTGHTNYTFLVSKYSNGSYSFLVWSSNNAFLGIYNPVSGTYSVSRVSLTQS